MTATQKRFTQITLQRTDSNRVQGTSHYKLFSQHIFNLKNFCEDSMPAKVRVASILLAAFFVCVQGFINSVFIQSEFQPVKNFQRCSSVRKRSLSRAVALNVDSQFDEASFSLAQDGVSSKESERIAHKKYHREILNWLLKDEKTLSECPYPDHDVTAALIYGLRNASRKGFYVDMVRYLENGLLPYLQLYETTNVDVNRIFGTALVELPLKAGPSKLRKIWSYCEEAHELSNQIISSYELTAYIDGLRKRKKGRTAIRVFHKFIESSIDLAKCEVTSFVACSTLKCLLEDIEASISYDTERRNISFDKLASEAVNIASSSIYFVASKYASNEREKQINYIVSSTFDVLLKCSNEMDPVKLLDLIALLFDGIIAAPNLTKLSQSPSANEEQVPRLDYFSLDSISFVKLIKAVASMRGFQENVENAKKGQKLSFVNTVHYSLLRKAIIDNLKVPKDRFDNVLNILTHQPSVEPHIGASKVMSLPTKIHFPVPNNIIFATIIQSAPLRHMMTLLDLFEQLNTEKDNIFDNSEGEADIDQSAVYEAALLACSRSEEDEIELAENITCTSIEKEELGLNILNEMADPTTNAYNLVLSCIKNDISLPRRLIEHMRARNIARNSVTYRNAILGSAGHDVDLINLAINDGSCDLGESSRLLCLLERFTHIILMR